MPRLTPARSVWLAALVACLVYAGALRNRWALDDHGVIERNPAAHSVGAAFESAFSPYWPPEGEFTAGLYRPLVILSYAVDWTLSGGSPSWFHLVNVLLHGAATALIVALALAWLPPAGALAAGLVFALHPVHVEAVANVVGRAEMLAGLGLLAALLAARQYRRAIAPRVRGAWLALALGATAWALLAKEHAVVAVALIALDHALDRRDPARPPGSRDMGNLYLGVAAITLAWAFLWRAIAGQLVESGAVITLRDLSPAHRLTTAVPVQLEALRLLVWPFRLAADYSPQAIPVRTTWTAAATLALIMSSALLALAIAVRRRAPAICFGILAAALTYLPTSNLMFVSGVVLAERALYLAVLAPALAVGWSVAHAGDARYRRPAAWAVAAVLLAFGWRTVSRVPYWRDTRTVVIQGFLDQPENFSWHVRLARALEQTGDTSRALAQYLAAHSVYDGYSFVPVTAGRLALATGRRSLALEHARRAVAIHPGHPGGVAFAVDVFIELGWADSALSVARAAVVANPQNLTVLETYASTLSRAGAPEWRHQLASARLEWRRGRLAGATALIDSAVGGLERVTTAAGCWEAQASLVLVRSLRAQAAGPLERLVVDCPHGDP